MSTAPRSLRAILPRPSAALLASIVATAALFVLYAATAAPDLTFWDAPELALALDRLGIPHPPGTPLYVVVGRAVRLLFGANGPARAATMVSVTAGALAGGATAWLVVRWTGAVVPALAAALASGTMFSVWRNATETEVYALSLLLSVLLLVIATRARAEVEASPPEPHADGSTVAMADTRAADAAADRWLLLGVYTAALAPALHLSALVAMPGAVVLAWPAVRGAWMRRDPRARAVALLAVLGVTALGLSTLAVLPVRAAWDPILNEGDPSSWSRWREVVQRAQYAVPGLWPRRAPWWLQLANVFEWADWQVARRLGPTPVPTIGRTAVTIGAAVLALVGAAAVGRRDGRLRWTLLVLVVSGTVGVAAWLNLLPGPSFGAGVIPDAAPHEARERDYFFVVGWWSWGVLLALGAHAVAERITRTRAAGVTRRLVAGLTLGVALVPAALNHPTVDRRPEPEAVLPRAFAVSLLEAAPPNAVLLLAGDLDGFPIWYLQGAEQRRLDVTPVILPLLGTDWYRRELARRARLVVDGTQATAVRAGAAQARRVVVASPLLTRAQRGSGGWVFSGMLFAASPDGRDGLDAGLVRQQAARVARGWLAPLPASADPASHMAQRALRCAVTLSSQPLAGDRAAAGGLLERVCELP